MHVIGEVGLGGLGAVWMVKVWSWSVGYGVKWVKFWVCFALGGVCLLGGCVGLSNNTGISKNFESKT